MKLITTDNLMSSKLEDGEVRGAIRLAASDDTLAPFTDATVEELKLKHPPRAANTQLFFAANATTQSTQLNSLMSKVTGMVSPTQIGFGVECGGMLFFFVWALRCGYM